MKKILLATLLSFSLVGCQTMDEMKEDINDGVSEIEDDMNDLKEDVQDPSYKYGLNLKELWTVPSFCNATIGTTLFRGY